MLRPILASLSLFSVSAVNAQTTIRLEVQSLPAFHATGSDIYMAGSFNGWNPRDTNYRFKRTEKGEYFLDLKLANGKYEYKLTRGGWDKAECTKTGGFRMNRVLVIPGDPTVPLNIEDWADRFATKPRVSTASRNVQVVDTAFLIPQLKRTRKVWIYLPAGYDHEKERYPVLYMHDGQNIFDDATSYSGEWGVDEFMDSMKSKCIVVAVDHGGMKRMNEYCPYDMDRFGKGEGDAYVDFLAATLKPFIDKNYRTLVDRQNTFIAGSSMGGLISMYAILKYPDVFGGAGVFSPSFWVSPGIFDYMKTRAPSLSGKLYFYAGSAESDEMVPDMQKASGLLSRFSRLRITTTVGEGGKHNEAAWRKEFPQFFNWIMK